MKKTLLIIPMVLLTAVTVQAGTCRKNVQVTRSTNGCRTYTVTKTFTQADINEYVNKYISEYLNQYNTQTTRTYTEQTHPTTAEPTTARPTTTTERATVRTTVEPTTEATTRSQTTTVSANTSSNTAEEILDLVNKERAANGLSPLTLNKSLSAVAQAKAEDMRKNNYFSHTSPTYGSPFEMMKSFGISYKTAGENIAKGQKSAAAVMNAWMNSEGHRKNILGTGFKQLGVGYVNSGGTTYWVQMFIG